LVADKPEIKKDHNNYESALADPGQQYDLIIDLLRQSLEIILLNQKELKQINQNLRMIISNTNDTPY
jgi:hypothetical protein